MNFLKILREMTLGVMTGITFERVTPDSGEGFLQNSERNFPKILRYVHVQDLHRILRWIFPESCKRLTLIRGRDLLKYSKGPFGILKGIPPKSEEIISKKLLTESREMPLKSWEGLPQSYVRNSHSILQILRKIIATL